MVLHTLNKWKKRAFPSANTSQHSCEVEPSRFYTSAKLQLRPLAPFRLNDLDIIQLKGAMFD